MLVTPLPIETLVKLVHCQNIFVSSVFKPFPIFALAKAEHFENEYFPTLVTLSGIVTPVKLLQLWNA
jgi:hypothetical protein